MTHGAMMVHHVYVKYGGPSCIGFRDIVWKNKKSGVNLLENFSRQASRHETGKFNMLTCTRTSNFQNVTYLKLTDKDKTVQVKMPEVYNMRLAQQLWA